MIIMSDEPETKIVHFSVDPEGIVDLARDRYWFEDAKQSGVNILRCFMGIEPYQITRILEGDGTIKEISEGIYHYEEIPDGDFKQKLKIHFDYRKRKSEDEAEKFIVLGGCKVDKELIEVYCDHVVKRLRDTMKMTAAGIMLDIKDMDEILGLETRRKELHDAILADAGFDRNDMSDVARTFRKALDSYVDARAGTLLDRPLDKDDMDKLEVELMRKQSDANVAYLNRMMRVKETVKEMMNNDPSYT